MTHASEQMQSAGEPSEKECLEKRGRKGTLLAGGKHGPFSVNILQAAQEGRVADVEKELPVLVMRITDRHRVPPILSSTLSGWHRVWYPGNARREHRERSGHPITERRPLKVLSTLAHRIRAKAKLYAEPEVGKLSYMSLSRRQKRSRDTRTQLHMASCSSGTLPRRGEAGPTSQGAPWRFDDMRGCMSIRVRVGVEWQRTMAMACTGEESRAETMRQSAARMQGVAELLIDMSFRGGIVSESEVPFEMARRRHITLALTRPCSSERGRGSEKPVAKERHSDDRIESAESERGSQRWSSSPRA
ncbi:hypothetical protein EDB87DRAFT_1826134 [Lactarius vividus]|nr:hypothetical protein EDB87DRAFT_1826134 [Lactarius vividus]